MTPKQMDKRLVRLFLEALAVGDAYGKATEYCTRQEIAGRYERIGRILPPQEALAHKDLAWGSVTDDTEQNIYLIREYARTGMIDAKSTALCLLRWMEETDAMKYIGPSSLHALRFIQDGGDIDAAGSCGTTCGGIMRTPSAFLFSTHESLERNVVECLRPTHNTAVAMEAAMSYAYALEEASRVECTLESVLERAKVGAALGRLHGDAARTNGVGPSVSARIDFLGRLVDKDISDQALEELLYDVIGSTMASADVACAVFAIFMHTRGDAARAIEIATMTGGDSDTIACLAAGLCTLFSKGHDIPQEEIALVEQANGLDFDGIADMIVGKGDMT